MFADEAIVYPLSLEAQVPGTTQDHLQIFNIEAKQKIKSHQMPEQVIALLFDLLTRFF